MRIRLITEDEHIALGGELSGMDVVKVSLSEKESLIDSFNASLSDNNIAIIILSEYVYRQLRNQVESHREKGITPLIVEIPIFGETINSIKMRDDEYLKGISRTEV